MSDMASQPERIQRSFLDIPDKAGVAEEMVEVDLALGRRGMGWETLLKSKRILIFSQAGVGKTFECQAEQKRLWDDGEPAYFLELAQLAKRNFRDMLSPEEEARFEAWSASSGQQATFFLDSYDELLLTLGSFRQAPHDSGQGLIRRKAGPRPHRRDFPTCPAGRAVVSTTSADPGGESRDRLGTCLRGHSHGRSSGLNKG